MRPMSHPDYVYRPASQQARMRMAAAHRRRLGIPDGYRRLWGVLVPNEHVDAIYDHAATVARFRGFEAANAYMRDAEANGWRVEPSGLTAWGERDWQLYRDLIAEGMSREEVAAFAKTEQWYLNKGVIDHRKGRRS